MAALYPQIATVHKGKVDYRRSEPGTDTGLPIECRTVELFGGKPVRKQAENSISDIHPSNIHPSIWQVRKPNGTINDRAVHVHPSSVLGAPARLSTLVHTPPPEQPASYLVYHSRIKTGRLYLCDATVVGPMHLLLFGDSLRVEAAPTSSGDAAPESSKSADRTMELSLSSWVHFKLSEASGGALLALREKIDLLVANRVAGGTAWHTEHEAYCTELVGVVAGVLQSASGDWDSGQELPLGWEVTFSTEFLEHPYLFLSQAWADPASSTGKVLYRNKYTGSTQARNRTLPPFFFDIPKQRKRLKGDVSSHFQVQRPTAPARKPVESQVSSHLCVPRR